MLKVDALIVAALQMEYEAAKSIGTKVDGTGVEAWDERDGDSPSPYLIGKYDLPNRRSLSIALARPTRMGGGATAPLAASLVERLKPTCLAMCGVCAGNPLDTALGDVIISEMVYAYDEGKRTDQGFQGDYRQTMMNDTWVRSAQELKPYHLPSYGPATADEAELWLLDLLYRGVDPRRHPARSRFFPAGMWGPSLRQIQNRGVITRIGRTIGLTDAGRSKVDESQVFDIDPPEHLPFAIHVGPIASGNVVVKDGLTWDMLKANGVRTVLGLEMEAATIGSIAHRLQVPRWVVTKGVMDHADPAKDDRYKSFAARASAEVLFHFLAVNIPALDLHDGSSSRKARDIAAYPVRISLSHARSTNDEAVRLIASGQNPPFLVHAWAQTHGRGKLDRVWQGGAGVLTASWVYQFPKSYVGYDVVGLAGIVSALSVTDAVKELCESSRQVQVKWPNDVLIDGKKVSGILIEIREGQEHFDVIAGIGVNVSRIPALTDLTVYSLPPTSIFDNYNDDDMREAQIDKTILKITEKLRIRLNALLTDRTLGAQRDDWQKLDSLNGKTIKISTPQNSYPLVANYAGINDKGQLVAEFKGGRSKAFFSADVVKIEDNDAALSELKEQAGQIQSKITETADGKYVLSSPITGTVHAILVSVGQRVQQGDILIYIEAMKSMLPLESEVAGTVSSIFTAEGDAIEFGDAILLIDVS